MAEHPTLQDVIGDGVAPTAPRGGAPSERAVPVRSDRRDLLLLIIIVPIVGALVAWLVGGFPRWARWLATAWTIVVLFAAIGMATDVFGRREQNPVPRAESVLVSL
jgi:hypothetical protein